MPLGYTRGSFFPPQMGGKWKINFPPWVPRNGGEIKISPPGVREMGGKYLKIFRRLRRAIQKTRFLRGFVVVFSDKLPYLRRFSPLTRYQRVSKRFAVRASAYLNCFYDYKKAFLLFAKRFAYRVCIVLDYRKTLLSFGINKLCVRGSRRRFYYSQKQLTRCIHRKIVTYKLKLSETVARRRRNFFKDFSL